MLFLLPCSTATCIIGHHRRSVLAASPVIEQWSRSLRLVLGQQDPEVYITHDVGADEDDAEPEPRILALEGTEGRHKKSAKNH